MGITLGPHSQTGSLELWLLLLYLAAVYSLVVSHEDNMSYSINPQSSALSRNHKLFLVGLKWEVCRLESVTACKP